MSDEHQLPSPNPDRGSHPDLRSDHASAQMPDICMSLPEPKNRERSRTPDAIAGLCERQAQPEPDPNETTSPTAEPVVVTTEAATEIPVTVQKETVSEAPVEDQKGVYRIKWIDCKKQHQLHPPDRNSPSGSSSSANLTVGTSQPACEKMAIITQNENGPCPLIAIMNVLLLKGDLRLPVSMDSISADQLMEHLGDCILSHMPTNLSNGAQLNYEQNMMDAISMLPKLQTGLDVNVRFTSVTDFEYTPELIVFDLLRIPLYHGWLVDQVQDPAAAQALGSCSYNQLVDKIISNKTSDNPDLVTEALLCEEFLETTATQLTYYGLEELTSHVKNDDPCVLFRNNHFITLLKHKNSLYQLVTDQGFLNESHVVWETLNNIEGDGEFVDQEFVLCPPKKSPNLTEFLSPEEAKHQEDQDYLLALSLQEEYKKEYEQMKEWERDKSQSGLQGLSDEELARRLQLEEQQQQEQSESSGHSSGQQQRHVKQEQLSSHHLASGHGPHERPVSSSSSSSLRQHNEHYPHPHHHHHHQQQQASQVSCRHEHDQRSGLSSRASAASVPGNRYPESDLRPTAWSTPPSSQIQSSSSSGVSSRRRTTSDSYADDSFNRRSPATSGHSGEHRHERRNKSSCVVM